jgi:hypothetical protein
MLCGMKATDEKMASLTQEDILDRINNKNVSQIFLKEKNFKAIIILLHSTFALLPDFMLLESYLDPIL